jgi:bifunctional non-homologous end joining protein LigD
VPTNTPKPDAKWVEPVLQVNIRHRGGLIGERVRRPVFEGVADKRAPILGNGKPKTPARVASENIMRELTDAVVPTASDLRAHWSRFAKRALPHLARRPLTLVRHVAGTTFYHMGPLPPLPSAVHQLEIRKADGKKGIRLWIDSLDGLIGLAEIGVVEVHPWAATIDDIERPDMLIFDLDPGDGVEWPFVAETALALRDLLTDEGFDSWPKLTGGTGLHLMAPIEPNLTHRQVHDYALGLADRIASRNPAKYTTLAGSSRRIGKLFIDHFRNGRGSSAIGTFSPRARSGLPIACPTTWKQIESGERTGGLRIAPGKR